VAATLAEGAALAAGGALAVGAALAGGASMAALADGAGLAGWVGLGCSPPQAAASATAETMRKEVRELGRMGPPL
jgi:hypothetical protein